MPRTKPPKRVDLRAPASAALRPAHSETPGEATAAAASSAVAGAVVAPEVPGGGGIGGERRTISEEERAGTGARGGASFGMGESPVLAGATPTALAQAGSVTASCGRFWKTGPPVKGSGTDEAGPPMRGVACGGAARPRATAAAVVAATEVCRGVAAAHASAKEAAASEAATA